MDPVVWWLVEVMSWLWWAMVVLLRLGWFIIRCALLFAVCAVSRGDLILVLLVPRWPRLRSRG